MYTFKLKRIQKLKNCVKVTEHLLLYTFRYVISTEYHLKGQNILTMQR
jgi:hypothetical protein